MLKSDRKAMCGGASKMRRCHKLCERGRARLERAKNDCGLIEYPDSTGVHASILPSRRLRRKSGPVRLA